MKPKINFFTHSSGMQTFVGWKRVADALVKSGEIRLRDGENLLGLDVDLDGLHVIFGKETQGVSTKQ